MSITKEAELSGMKNISEVVAITLREMRKYSKPGMTSKQLDDFGGQILNDLGAKSAPRLTYGFPGWTCISINNEIAHGIPSEKKILQEGDLINIDVSAELDGFWSDNAGSFVLGQDFNNHQHLVDTSKHILQNAINNIKSGVRVSAIGHLIETEAKKSGYKVIKNLMGHGVGRSLHEEPFEIANYCDKYNFTKFRNNAVVAIETFISTLSTIANTQRDGWTLVGDKGGFVAQHEHTVIVTLEKPIILTTMNDLFN